MPITPKPAKWTPATDINFYNKISVEAAALYFRELEVWVIDRDKTVVDQLYGESKNIYYTPYAVRAQCVINPKKTDLTKWGLDDNRDLIVNIPTAVINAGSGEEGDYPSVAGGYPLPQEGDVFILEGEEFRVMDETKIDYFWHTEANLGFSFSCIRQRPRSVDDAVLVDEDNIAGPKEIPIYNGDDFPGAE